MKQFEKILIAVSILFALFKIIISIWAADKGFDPTDESFLINGYRHWNIYNTFDYFRVLNLFFHTETISVYGYRLMRIAAELFSAILFTCVFYNWYTNENRQSPTPSWIYFFCCCVAIFQSILFRSISYNEFVYVLIVATWSALLLCEIKKNIIAPSLAYTAAGFFTSLLFFIKSPAALAEVILLIIYSISALRIYQKKQMLLFWVCFVTGFVTFLFIYLGTASSIISWFKNFLWLVNLYRDMEYSISTLLVYLITELGEYLLALVVSILIVELIKKIFRLPDGKSYLWILHLLVVLLVSLIPPYFLGMHSSFGILHSFILVFAVIIYHINIKSVTSFLQPEYKRVVSFFTHRNIVLSLIVLFHFVIVGGSVVSFSEMFFFFQTPALLVLVVPAHQSFYAIQRNSHYYALLSGLLILMVSAFVFFNIIHPSGLPENLFAQNQPAEISETLLLDKTSCKTLGDVNHILNKVGFSKGKPIVSFDYFCGVAYLVGGYSPGCACYPPTSDRKEKFNCYFLQSIETTSLPDTIPVFYSTDKSLETLLCLSNGKKKYHYQFVDSVFNGYSLNPENKILMGEQSNILKIGLLIATDE